MYTVLYVKHPETFFSLLLHHFVHKDMMLNTVAHLVVNPRY